MSVTYIRNAQGVFEQVGPGGATTDTTLSQAGKPADAAAVGAALTNYSTQASVSDQINDALDVALESKSDVNHSHSLADFGFQYGKIAVSCTANQVSSADVTFTKEYKTMPIVTVTAGSSAPGTSVQEVSVSDITYTGFKINVYRKDTNVTTIQWMAAGTPK